MSIEQQASHSDEERRLRQHLLDGLAKLLNSLLPEIKLPILDTENQSYLEGLSHLWLKDLKALFQALVWYYQMGQAAQKGMSEEDFLRQDIGLDKKTINYLETIFQNALWLDHEFLARSEIEIETADSYMTDLASESVPLGFKKKSLVKITFQFSDLLCLGLSVAERKSIQDYADLTAEHERILTGLGQLEDKQASLDQVASKMRSLPQNSVAQWREITQSLVMGFQDRTKVQDSGLCFYLPVDLFIAEGIINDEDELTRAVIIDHHDLIRRFVIGAEQVTVLTGGFTSGIDFFPSAAGKKGELHLAMFMNAILDGRVLAVGHSGPLMTGMEQNSVTMEEGFGTNRYALVLAIILRFLGVTERIGADDSIPTSLIMLGHSMGGAALLDMAEHIPYLDFFDKTSFLFLHPAISALKAELDSNSWADATVSVQEGFGLNVFGPLLVQSLVPLINRIQKLVDSRTLDQLVYETQFRISVWFVSRAFLAGLDKDMRDIIIEHVYNCTFNPDGAAKSGIGSHVGERPPHSPQALQQALDETCAVGIMGSSRGDQMVRYKAVLRLARQASIMLAAFDANTIDGSHYEFKRLFWIRQMEIMIQAMSKLRTKLPEQSGSRWHKFDFQAMETALERIYLVVDKKDKVRNYLLEQEEHLASSQRDWFRYAGQKRFLDYYLADYWERIKSWRAKHSDTGEFHREEEQDQLLAYSYLRARLLFARRVNDYLQADKPKSKDNDFWVKGHFALVF